MVNLDEHIALKVAKSLMADADSPEMIEYVKNNTSTDLTPTMRLTLHKILGWHPPYDDTRNSFLDGIGSTLPKYYDGFAKLLKDIECHENLIPLIEDMILDGLNPKYNDANEFAQRWAKALNDTRAKAITRPKTGMTKHSIDKHKQQEKKKEHMRKLYHFFKDKGFKEKQCYNLISSKHYPEHPPSTVETYINEK